MQYSSLIFIHSFVKRCILSRHSVLLKLRILVICLRILLLTFIELLSVALHLVKNVSRLVELSLGGMVRDEAM